MTSHPVREIDGERFDDLEGFWDEVGHQLFQEEEGMGCNLDAFNDMLRGGFGSPEGGFVLRWVNSDRSREALGYQETIRWLEKTLDSCHPTNIPSVKARLKNAKTGKGPTMFDMLVEIISAHGVGGVEEEDSIELQLL